MIKNYTNKKKFRAIFNIVKSLYKIDRKTETEIKNIVEDFIVILNLNFKDKNDEDNMEFGLLSKKQSIKALNKVTKNEK